MQNITQDDLLEALREAMTPKAGEDGEGYRTVQDLVTLTKTNENTIRRALKSLQAEGRLEVKRVNRVSLAGCLAWSPAYRVRPA